MNGIEHMKGSLALVFLTLLAIPAAADPRVLTTEEDHFSRGMELWREAKKEVSHEAVQQKRMLALHHFNQARQILARERNLMMSALAYQALGLHWKALPLFERFLAKCREDVPDKEPPHLKQVEAHIERCRAQDQSIQLARRLLGQGKWNEARKTLQQAKIEGATSPRMKRVLARCYEEAGEPHRAAALLAEAGAFWDSYKTSIGKWGPDYLVPNTPDLQEATRLVREVEAEQEALKQRWGDVKIICSIAGAIVVVDGVNRGRTPLPRPLRLRKGKHVVVVQKPDFLDSTMSLTVVGGGIQEQVFHLQHRPPPPVGSSRTTWAAVALGAGAVFTATAVVLYSVGKVGGDKAHEQYMAATQQGDISRYREEIGTAEDTVVVGHVMLGLAAASAGVSAYLYFTRTKTSEHQEPKQKDHEGPWARTEIGLLPSPNGGGLVSLMGRF